MRLSPAVASCSLAAVLLAAGACAKSEKASDTAVAATDTAAPPPPPPSPMQAMMGMRKLDIAALQRARGDA